MLRISNDLLALAAASLAIRQQLNLPPGRCVRCRDRAAIAISYIGADEPPEGDPAPCACGWAPHAIEIEFVARPAPRP